MIDLAKMTVRAAFWGAGGLYCLWSMYCVYLTLTLTRNEIGGILLDGWGFWYTLGIAVPYGIVVAGPVFGVIWAAKWAFSK